VDPSACGLVEERREETKNMSRRKGDDDHLFSSHSSHEHLQKSRRVGSITITAVERNRMESRVSYRCEAKLEPFDVSTLSKYGANSRVEGIVRVVSRHDPVTSKSI